MKNKRKSGSGFENLEVALCRQLADTYDKISRQLCNLAVSWGKFAERDPEKSDKAPSATARRKT